MLGLFLCLIGVACFFLLAYRDLLIGRQTNASPDETAQGLVLLWGYREAVFAVLIVICPLLGVRAVSEEREGRSLDLLFTAPLSRLAFLAAKVGSTMLQITLGLIATLPFVSVTVLMGGVGPWDLFWCFAAHLTSAFFYLVLGWYAGHQEVPAGQALQESYGLVALFHGPVILMLLAYVALAIPGKLSSIAIEGALVAMLGFNVVITISNALAGWLFLVNVSRRIGQESGRKRQRRKAIVRNRPVRRYLWSWLGKLEDGEPLPDTMDPIYARDLGNLRRTSLSGSFDPPSMLFILSFVSFPMLMAPELVVWIGLILLWIPNVLLAARLLASEYERENWESIAATLCEGRTIVSAKYRLTIKHALLHIYPWLLVSGLLGCVVLGLFWIRAALLGEDSPVDFFEYALPYMATLFLLSACAVLHATVGLAAAVWTRRQYPALLLGLATVGALVLAPVLTARMGGAGQAIAEWLHPAFAVQAIGNDGLYGLLVCGVQVAWMLLVSAVLYAWVRRRAAALV